MRLPYLPLVIDEFRPAVGVRVYFLSHFHTDHLVGLSSTWSHGTIYCSPITRALVLHRFALPSDRVVALPENGVQSVIPLVDQPFAVQPPDGSEAPLRLAVTVATYDSNHIPGAVMFHILSPIGKFLYTGDFRFAPEAFSPILRSVGDQELGTDDPLRLTLDVDHLIVDDTWLHLREDTHFLTRGELFAAFGKITEYIRYLESKQTSAGEAGFVVRCYLHNHFGKEGLLQQLAMQLDAIIVLDDDRYNLMRVISSVDPSEIELSRFSPCSRFGQRLEVRGTSEQLIYQVEMPRRRIEIVNSRAQVTPQRLQEDERSTGLPHMGIIMSGWAGMQRRPTSSEDPVHNIIWKLPYSLHCTPRELLQFVAAVRPQSIVSLHHAPRKDSDGTAHHRGSVLLKSCARLLKSPGVNAVVSPEVLQEALPLGMLKQVFDLNSSASIRSCTGRFTVPERTRERQAGIKISRRSDTPASDSDSTGDEAAMPNSSSTPLPSMSQLLLQIENTL